MALAAILAGKTQVVLRQTDLAQGVKVTEGNPQEALVNLQQVFLFGEPEKRPKLCTLCVSFQASEGRVMTVIPWEEAHI